MNEIEASYKFIMYPVISSTFYLSSCKFLSSYRVELNELYKNDTPYIYLIKCTGAVYNLVMSIYSGVTFDLLCRELLNDYGSVFDYYAWLSTTIATSCWIFLHSKTVEYFDTFFILLKGGKPIFLQEYHHFGAVWSWFLPLYVDSSAIIIATLLNSFVHTVMYFYYSLSVFDSRKRLVPIKPLITTMQLVQFFTAFYICNTGYISTHAHNQDWKFMMAIYVFQVYGFLLILLFLNFADHQYIKKKQR